MLSFENCPVYKSWNFPGKEIGIKIDLINTENFIVAIFGTPTSEDIMELMHFCDAAYNMHPDMPITIYLPYLPYARQDRVCHPGENFGLDVFVRMLSILKNIYVVTADVHSSVAEELFRKYSVPFYNIPQETLAHSLPNKYDFLISPDKGSRVKIGKHPLSFTTPVVCMEKTRTPDGVVYEEYKPDTLYGQCIVIDDLCDFGGTFVSLGKMLKKTQPRITALDLYVTHGLFGKGIEEIKQYYSEIFVYNLLNGSVADSVTLLAGGIKFQ